MGQWSKFKIYLCRMDISTNGHAWGYFALNGHWDDATKGSYSVVAHPPWLKALYLFPQGNTWGGGIEFGADYGRWMVMADGTRHSYSEGPIYKMRLARNGWSEGMGGFTKPVSRKWTLVKRVQGGNRPEQHALVSEDGKRVDLSDWGWADIMSASNRLVWTVGGKLFALPLPLSAAVIAPRGGDSVLQRAELLLDVSDEEFQNRKAPYNTKTVFVEGDTGDLVIPWPPN
jgi:hypothetical protein